jgi:hypothetical protein
MKKHRQNMAAPHPLRVVWLAVLLAPTVSHAIALIQGQISHEFGIRTNRGTQWVAADPASGGSVSGIELMVSF